MLRLKDIAVRFEKTMSAGALDAPAHSRLPYRPDIEGLRAVAILLVVGCHAKVTGLSGGFIGVDVFFVLSGFLITGLIVQEIKSTNHFGFMAFYARRFRRLMPGLLVMLLVTRLLAAQLLPAIDQPPQSMAAASAAFWLSNFYFATSDLDYFTQEATSNLYLHTWSLGVEEQFYLVWPIVVVLSLGALSVQARHDKFRRLKIVMLFVFAASFLLCVIQTKFAPRLAFYLTPARGWQFALGALVLLFRDKIQGRHGTQNSAPEFAGRYSGWAGYVGFALVLGSAIVLNAGVPYPGVLALIPSIGTALVLSAGSATDSKGVARLLSVKPLQAIGKVSYSWYLWHWPILLLGAAVIDMEDRLKQGGVVALSLVLAALSYRFIEDPIRRSGGWLAKPRAAVAMGLTLMVAANVMAISWHNMALEQAMQPEQAPYQRTRAAAMAINRMNCDDWYNSSEVHVCAFGPADADHTAIMIGDSIAMQWFPALERITNDLKWRLLVLGKSACPMVDRPIFYSRIGRVYTECAQWRHDALERIASLKPTVVILASASNYNFTQEQWTDGSVSILQSLSRAAKHVYVLRSTPMLPFDGPSCLAPRGFLYRMLSDGRRCEASAHTSGGDDVYRWLEVAANRVPNTTLVDMTDAICPDGQCRAERAGLIVFRDTQHLSVNYVKTLEDSLGQRLRLSEYVN